jgi:hypothetical protein
MGMGQQAGESISRLFSFQGSIVVKSFADLFEAHDDEAKALEVAKFLAKYRDQEQEINRDVEEGLIRRAKRRLERKKSAAVPKDFTTYKERIVANTASQEAGVPVVFDHSGLTLSFARGYLSGGRPPKRTPRRKVEGNVKAEETRPPVTSIQQAEEMAELRKDWKEWMAWCEFDNTNPWVERRNFWSEAIRAYVIIFQNRNTGKVRAEIVRDDQGRINIFMNTYMASRAFSVETEMRAMEKLKGHVDPKQFERYFITGSFVEQSKRTGILYIFRRMRPTVAIRYDGKKYNYLAALCMHPAAYYGGSWCGALCPSDDVIAHLMYMRADEYSFWKKSTHHPRHAAQADF